MTKKKILMVDDDPAVTDYMRLKLEKDYEVLVTNAPSRVLQIARQQQPALILCDIDMPDMDGGDVCRALSDDRETRHIPFAYLTSIVSADEAQAMENKFGGQHGISKHASIEESLARIKAIIG
ncbi:MAG: response regulator [Pseudomonadota bacterium]